MKNNLVLDTLMNTPRIKNLGLRRETIVEILQTYNDIAFHNLLDHGYIELNNGLLIEIVKILDRVHVLRGVSYKSSRKYKLKLSMNEDIYQKIDDYYSKLEEDIS